MRDTMAVEKYLQHHFFSRLVPVTLHLTWWCWWYAHGKFTIGFGSYRKHHGSWAVIMLCRNGGSSSTYETG